MFNNPEFCEGCQQICCKAPFLQMFATKEITRLAMPLGDKKQKFNYCEELHGKRTGGCVQTMKHGYFTTAAHQDGSCAFLQNKRCEIYEKRGLDCRLYPYFFEFDQDKKEIVFYLDTESPCTDKVKEEEIQADIPDVVAYVSKELKNWTLMEMMAYTHLPPNSRSNHPREIKRVPYDVSTKRF